MAAPLQLAEALLKYTKLSEEGLGEALKRHEETGRRLTDVLLELELLEESELLGVLERARSA